MSVDRKPESLFYRRIKDAFNNASDTYIAGQLGTTKSAVSQWKKGKTKPSTAILLKAAEKTGLPYKWFLTGDKKYLPGKQNEPEMAEVEPSPEREYESLFRDISKLNPEHKAKFEAIMEYAEHQVEQMLKEQENESPRPKGKRS